MSIAFVVHARVRPFVAASIGRSSLSDRANLIPALERAIRCIFARIFARSSARGVESSAASPTAADSYRPPWRDASVRSRFMTEKEEGVRGRAGYVRRE